MRNLITAVLLILLSDFVCSNPETVSVGKLRSGAELAFSKGEIDQALNLWEQVIALEPQNDGNFYKRFRIYLRQQKLKEALADLNSAITLNPKNDNALTQRVKLQMKLGRCVEADEDLERLRLYE